MKKWEGYEHGVNLGGWLSQCDHTKERYDTFITEEDIMAIRSWGAVDHIRVPVDYDLVETSDGEYKEEGFAYIEKVIAWAKTYGLHMILDLHKTFGYSFDTGEGESGFFENEDYQERFYKLWEEFAKRFSQYEEMLAFELLNEVTDKEFCEPWNRIASCCIQRIRKIAPTIKIVVGGYYYNSAKAVKDLDLPADDNLIYNFHCYEPTVFTHQGAYWMETMDSSFRISLKEKLEILKQETARMQLSETIFEGVDLNGYYDVNVIDAFVKEAVETAEQAGVPLYCGEYGVIDRADPEDIVKWYRIMHEMFQKYGIGHAAWSYKEMDFGLSNPYLETVWEELIQLL